MPEESKIEQTPVNESSPQPALPVEQNIVPEVPASQPEPVTPAPAPANDNVKDPVATPVEPMNETNNPLNPPSQGGLIGLLMKAKEKIMFRKKARLEKIMALIQNKAVANNGQGKITNDEVEKLLRVSDATATRYLSELVMQGRLRRVGLKKASFYELVN